MQKFQDPPLTAELSIKSTVWQNWFRGVTARFGSGKLPSAVTPGASPYVYQNTTQWDQIIIVKGGTVSKIEFSRDRTNWYDVGVTAGMQHVPPADFLRVTYSVAPTMTMVNR